MTPFESSRSSVRRWTLACGLLLGWLGVALDGAAESPPEPTYDQFERSHWAFQPRRSAPPPGAVPAAAQTWSRTPIDLWIVNRLSEEGLTPAPEASTTTLVRRLTYDLTGLPPTPDDVAAFERDAAAEPDAYERLVDRLLASPRHGERAAQAWLDVVRYAETEGYEYDNHRPGAWRYRDYVVRSFNEDKPFDRFAREQLAGDESPAPSPAAQTAVGFHRLGPVRRNAGNSDVAFSRNEVLTEMTDAIGAVFLGLTLGCARCHDHKFDAIRQLDYYRLQAFLGATDEFDVQLAPPEDARRWKEETERIQAEMKKIREQMQTAQGQARDDLALKHKQLAATLPAPLPTISSMRNKAELAPAVKFLERGMTERATFAVAPRTLGVLTATGAPEPDLSRPKSALADWLMAPDHPLVARVLANRIWQSHFGAGLVATPNDLGVNGAAPSHPQLLDWLAERLVADWQLKPLRRTILTSAAYRQASRTVDAAATAAGMQVDPDDRWLWRFPRRRLEAEALRDTFLAVAGRLDLTMAGPSIIVPVDKELVDLLYKPEQWEVTPGEAARHRRSIYLIAKRNLRVPLLETFDQPDLATSCGRRTSSTHAPQALELLNGAFANELADALAARLEREAGQGIDVRIELGFRLVAGRGPTDQERELSREFLARSSPREFALALLNLNALLYVD